MVKNPHIIAAFERESLSGDILSLDKKYGILDEMYSFARQMGALEKNTSLDDTVEDVEIARILHLHVQKTSH